ncbi:MAG TPA: flagellar biosynthetic protein FliO [Solirubrobacteraceae bacterium]
MTKLIPSRAATLVAALLCGCLLAWAGPACAFTPSSTKKGAGENTPLNLGSPTTSSHTSSGGASLVRTIVGLAIVIAVIWGLSWILRQVKAGREPQTAATGLSSVAALTLTSGRSVHLVKAGNDYLLLGSAEHGLMPIHRYTEQQAFEAGLLSSEEPAERPRRRLGLLAPATPPQTARSAISPGAISPAISPETASPAISPGAASPSITPGTSRRPMLLGSGEHRPDPMHMPSVSSSLIERLRELTVRR